MEEAVDEDQSDTAAEQHIGDVENPGEHLAAGARPMPAGQGIDHVAHITKAKAIVHVAQYAGQQQPEDELIEALAAAGGEQVGEKRDGGDGDDEEQPALSLTETKDGTFVDGDLKVQPVGDDDAAARGEQITAEKDKPVLSAVIIKALEWRAFGKLREGKFFRPEIKRKPGDGRGQEAGDGGGGAEIFRG